MEKSLYNFGPISPKKNIVDPFVIIEGK